MSDEGGGVFADLLDRVWYCGYCGVLHTGPTPSDDWPGCGCDREMAARAADAVKAGGK